MRVCRRLSTGGPAKRATEVEAAELSQLDKLKLNAPTYAAIAGGVLVVYGVSKTGAVPLAALNASHPKLCVGASGTRLHCHDAHPLPSPWPCCPAQSCTSPTRS